MNIFVPVMLALLLWWTSTAVLLALVRRPTSTYRSTLIGVTLVLLASLFGILLTRSDPSAEAAFIAFACEIGVWAWQEAAFLTGWIIGSRRQPSLASPGSARHFRDALESLLHHELLLLALGGVILLLVMNAINPVAWHTFLLLWASRLSAKLNLYLGVRNTGAHLLPASLVHLRGYFRHRAMNLLFPLSVTAGTVALVFFIRDAKLALAAGNDATGSILLATLMALALFEHWLMVLSWNGDALWRVALRQPSGNATVNARGSDA